MTKGLISYFSTLQYSIAPLLQCRDFQELSTTFKLLRIGYNPEKKFQSDNLEKDKEHDSKSAT